MQRYAIMFRVRPGTEDQVKELLAGYEPPEWVTPDGARLLGTSIFIKDGLVVRMMEVDGPLPSIMAHLARQPSIQQLERDLDPFLAEPRDLSTPEGARAFFGRAMMEHVTTRVATLEAST
ncbi:SchA/CurD-like domain-containing protein [Microlunatus sp. GCM10028923]|uniref:SchA/CurD-like domain-containing protein n=1 Tax=Microlunatus sp. GCM10028923 TaxID=3273400 RepID=UPI00361137F2